MHTLEFAIAVSLAPLALSSGCDMAGPEGGDDVLDSTEESLGDDDDDDDETPESDDDDDDDDDQPSSDDDDDDDDDDDAPEFCNEYGQSRSCTMASGGSGTQFCTGDQNLIWGACLDSVECEIGETLECGYCDDPDSFECEACGEWTETCSLVNGAPTFGEEACACNTPLVLSFDGAPVRMQPAPASTFDIDGVGACITTDWPEAATPWLALDLDRSGSIETGRELFGSGTVLASGERASNGFLALSELDDNGDGRIDVTDSRFTDLVLWADEDADKAANFDELQPLAMRGILSIELDYRSDRQCDDRGNCGVERAAFTYIAAGGDVREGEVVDIHLACQ